MSATPHPIKLVIFDWAGTVVDFGCVAPAGAFVAVFAAAGVPVSVAEARGPMGLHKKDHIRVMLRQPALAARWRAKHGRDWVEADVDALYRAVTPLQAEAAGRHADVIPGTLEAAAALRAAGVKIAGTTGYFVEAAEACYARARQQGYAPDYTICADEVPVGRPAPWMLFRAMEALNAYPPAAVVKVGDTAVDIAEGKAAGVWTVGVTDGANGMGLTPAEFAALSHAERTARRAAVAAGLYAAGADAVVAGPADVPGVLRRLGA